jgi:hypothetical protein
MAARRAARAGAGTRSPREDAGAGDLQAGGHLVAEGTSPPNSSGA